MLDFLLLLAAAPWAQAGFSGALGGVARWLYAILADKGFSLGKGSATVALGLIMGAFFGEPFAPGVGGMLVSFHLAVDPERLPWISGFVVGASAVLFLGAAFDFLKKRAEVLTNSDGGAQPPKKPGDVP